MGSEEVLGYILIGINVILFFTLREYMLKSIKKLFTLFVASVLAYGSNDFDDYLDYTQEDNISRKQSA